MSKVTGGWSASEWCVLCSGFWYTYELPELQCTFFLQHQMAPCERSVIFLRHQDSKSKVKTSRSDIIRDVVYRLHRIKKLHTNGQVPLFCSFVFGAHFS